MRSIVLVVGLLMIGVEADAQASEELKLRQLLALSGTTGEFSIAARDDSTVGIAIADLAVRERCTLQLGDARRWANDLLALVERSVSVSAGEESHVRSAAASSGCSLLALRVTTASAARYELLHTDLVYTVRVRATEPEVRRVVGALNAAADSARAMNARRMLARGAAGKSREQTYFDFQVEKPASLKPGSVEPTYPTELRASEATGNVLAQFVVDERGRVDTTTFKVLKRTHALFAIAVREALPAMQFLPAELQGRPVRQLVQQPFEFHVNR